MAEITRVAKISDGVIGSLIDILFEFYPDATVTLGFRGGSVQNRLTIEALPKLGKSSKLVEFFLFHIEALNKRIEFRRGLVDPNQFPNKEQITAANFGSYRLPSAVYDEIGIFRHTNNQADQPLSLESITAYDKFIGRYSSLDQSRGSGNLDQASAMALQQIESLRQLSIDNIEQQSVAKKKLEDEYLEKERFLQEKFEVEQKKLAEDQDALERYRDEINDRAPTHERRQIRVDLTTRLQTSISEPRLETARQETRAYHWYLIAGTIFLLISVTVSYFLFSNSTPNSPGFWFNSFKSIASGAVGAGLVWAGLGGLKSASIAARTYEQKIQKYAFDMDRASWIVETLLEMNSVEAANVPDQWLQSVCHNLFSDGSNTTEEPKALNALAALLDATASATVGTNGLEFEIDKKGAKKMSKQVETS